MSMTLSSLERNNSQLSLVLKKLRKVGDRVSGKARRGNVIGTLDDIHTLAGGTVVYQVLKDDTGSYFWCLEEDLILLPPDEVLT